MPRERLKNKAQSRVPRILGYGVACRGDQGRKKRADSTSPGRRRGIGYGSRSGGPSRITIRHSDKSILLHFPRCPASATLGHSDEPILLHFPRCPTCGTPGRSDNTILLHFLRCPTCAAFGHLDISILLHFLSCPACGTPGHSDNTILLHFPRCPACVALRHSDKSILLHFPRCPTCAASGGMLTALREHAGVNRLPGGRSPPLVVRDVHPSRGHGTRSDWSTFDTSRPRRQHLSGSHALRGNRSSPRSAGWANTSGTTSIVSPVKRPLRSGHDAERRRRHSHAERRNEGETRNTKHQTP